MLAFVMLWAYFSFSQYLIIWSGNLPEEIAWYLHRLQTGWRFDRRRADRRSTSPLPFVLLLSRHVKREPRPDRARWRCAILWSRGWSICSG